jgi:hypothetical protein
MPITAEISKTIEETFAAYVTDPEPHVVKFDPPINMRELAAQLRLLPVVLDMGGCYCLQSDGEIFAFTWDEPHKLILETDPRIRNLVLFQAAKKFPALKPLIPPRPATAHDCDSCKGAGVASGFPPELAKDIVCFCGGLGWIP